MPASYDEPKLSCHVGAGSYLLMFCCAAVFIPKSFGGLETSNTTIFPELDGQDMVPGENFWGFASIIFGWDILVNTSQVRAALVMCARMGPIF